MRNQLHVGTKADLSFNLRHFRGKKIKINFETLNLSFQGTFQTQSALGLHLCYDTYIPKKKMGEPYKCEKCDKHYSNRKTFRYHLQSAHTTEKRYQCDKCDFR